MLHPVGSLPASVYWRRRAVAIAAALGVLLMVWVALPHGDGGGGGRQDTAALVGSPSPIGGGADLAGRDAAGGRPRPGRQHRRGRRRPGHTDDQPGRPPPPPKPCTDRALSLRVVPERPAYQVGAKPVFDLVVRNVSAASCVRDLGARLQEVLLYAGARRLWSSNDCYPEGERNVRVLRPAESATFSVEWSGLSSRPSCAGTRVRVGTGTYAAVARLGTLVSPRARLDLR